MSDNTSSEDEQVLLPKMSEYLSVLTRQREWTAEEQMRREGNIRWMLGEAEAWVFLASWKTADSEEIRLARQHNLQMALEIVGGFPAELRSSAVGVLREWVPTELMAEFQAMANVSVGMPGNVLRMELEDELAGYCPGEQFWGFVFKDASAPHVLELRGRDLYSEIPNTFVERLDSLLVNFARSTIGQPRLQEELLELKADFAAWESQTPMATAPGVAAFRSAISGIAGLSFDEGQRTPVMKLISELRRLEAPHSPVYQAPQDKREK